MQVLHPHLPHHDTVIFCVDSDKLYPRTTGTSNGVFARVVGGMPWDGSM